MAPERGVLGALLGFRCVSDAKPPRVAPGTTACTQKGNENEAKAGLAASNGSLGSPVSAHSGKAAPAPVMDPGRDEDQPRCSGKKVSTRAARQRELPGSPGSPGVPGIPGSPGSPGSLSTSAKARRYSLWHLAGVEVRAFGGRDARTFLRRALFRTAMLLSLVAYAKRVHPSGQALCLLWLRPWRFLGGIAALLLVVCTTGALYPVLGAVLVVVITAVLLPCVIGTVKARPGWKELAKLTPPGRHVYVHSVASQLPGAGAEVLRGLALEADEERWSLVLDASNEKLVRYYEQFGFRALGPGVQMPDGARHVRMWRPPITPERGPLCGRTGYGAISTR